MSHLDIRSSAVGITTRLTSVPPRLLLVGLLLLITMVFGADPVTAKNTCGAQATLDCHDY
ncbi:hypothetical protein BRC81_11280 [Halobacteriales archaeon QS_1_68_20]|nr:MAG: hypothetical protein BRC81_11280 [Halobacteriales archaeon QS_1_68_20]